MPGSMERNDMGIIIAKIDDEMIDRAASALEKRFNEVMGWPAGTAGNIHCDNGIDPMQGFKDDAKVALEAALHVGSVKEWREKSGQG